jgi:exodeoxyribonuclease V beta subunit
VSGTVTGFDVCGPLPTGVTVLEASAGTGKTFTIAALAARYVAEGRPLKDLLLVTFTRMATGELRERVRERLVKTEQELQRHLDGKLLEDERDRVVRLLLEGTDADVELRRDRLARALADFDAATITTTHGFCQEVLEGFGIGGDVERDVTFVEEVTDLVEEVVDDLYVRRFVNEEAPAFDRREAGRIARIAVANPAAPIEPREGDGVPAMRRRLAEKVREVLDERKRSRAIMDFDDLLTRLRKTLADPETGPAAVAQLRERYKIVLVDEFQDTDPVQWEIMSRAFGDGTSTLVLIGDPKQAIYAFRGGDVYAYLEAKATADADETLRTNWRSDQGLIDAYDALFGSAKLGHEGIVYREVHAAEANQRPRLTGAPSDAPLRVRLMRADAVSRTRTGFPRAGPTREHIARDLAADVVALLDSGAEIEARHDDGSPKGRTPICPGHVAVLVRTNRNAAMVRDALEEVGVPAVINGAGSVFGTDPAREWLRLLEALERPTSELRARSVALTCFFGWSTERIASADDEAWEDVHRRLHHWAAVLRTKGVASLTEAVTLTEGLPGRVLADVDGERRLTDLRHVAQLLHAAAKADQLGVTALTSWLRRRIAAAEDETGDEERSRRLESDAEAVQVLTFHRSKGLEFPVVYYPYLFEPSPLPREGEPIFFHDPDAGNERTVDVGLEGPSFKEHRVQHIAEQRGEDLRLAYVALTRAQHQAVVWWAGTWDSRDSALGRLLFARGEDGDVAPSGAKAPTEAEARERFEALAAAASGRIAIEPSVLRAPERWGGVTRDRVALDAASFDRTLDWWWRRTSYSDITSGAYEARVASEPEERVVADEPAGDEPPRAAAGVAGEDEAALRAVPALLGDMPHGVHVGTFVHRVLEAADFAAPDLDAELRAQIAAVQGRRPVDAGDPAVVVRGLRAALETPLGPLLGEARLADVARADRLDELDFELPLVGGDEPTGRLELAEIGALLREHLPAGDALHGYAARLADPALRQDVRGYLTGSIDLVARVGGRYAVVDYKTNWLGAEGEPLSAWHLRPSALAAEMDRSHYALQTLLYTAALHRYLRWRLPGYDPDQHLAGVLYLFVRGMVGAETPTVGGVPCGVFAWRPPAALVEALSDVLDRGSVAA